jgi:hypothetical protein
MGIGTRPGVYSATLRKAENKPLPDGLRQLDGLQCLALRLSETFSWRGTVQRCEYATFRWEGSGRGAVRCVVFTHGERWDALEGDQFMPTLCRLQDDGWELMEVQHYTDDNVVFSFRRPLGDC